MNQVASKPAEPNQRKPHHYLFAFAVSIVGFLVTLGTVSALKWFGHRPFAGEGQSLGLIMISLSMFLYLLPYGLERWRQLLSWCIAAIPVAAIVTVVLAFLLTALSAWTRGQGGIGHVLVSVFGAVTAVVSLLAVTGRILGPPEWQRLEAQGGEDEKNA